MTKKIVLVAALALLAAPLAAAEERPPAPSDKTAGDKAAESSDAAKKRGEEKKNRANRHPRKAELKQAMRQCVALKKQLGARDFAAAYPTLRACLKARIAAEREHRDEAEADCRAKLGKRANPKRIAACAGKEAAHDSAEERAAVVGAAKACAEKLAADPAAFREDYGTGHTLANAFGKCVAAKASGTGDEDEDAKEDEEQADDEHEDEHESEEDEHDEDEPDDKDGEDGEDEEPAEDE